MVYSSLGFVCSAMIKTVAIIHLHFYKFFESQLLLFLSFVTLPITTSSGVMGLCVAEKLATGGYNRVTNESLWTQPHDVVVHLIME